MARIKKHKHFGDRDPLKQRAVREMKLAKEKKINNPPKEDQEMSKSFKKFIELKNSVKDIGKQNKKKEKRKTIHDDFMKVDKVDKKFSNETNRAYLRRVERVIEKKKVEAEFAKKYKVQIVRDDVSGEIKVRKDPVALEKKKLPKVPKKVEETETIPTDPKKGELKEESEFPLVKYQMNEKKKRKLDNADFIPHDNIKFGEFVKEPPTFNLPQKANAKASKPGSRNFLFSSKLK